MAYDFCFPPVIDANDDVFSQEGWLADDGGWVSTPGGLSTDYYGLVEIDADGATRTRDQLLGPTSPRHIRHQDPSSRSRLGAKRLSGRLTAAGNPRLSP